MNDMSRPLPFLQSTKGIFNLSLEGMVWSRRSLMMAILLGVPFLFVLGQLFFSSGESPPRVMGLKLYDWIVAFYYIRNVLPLVALFYAGSLIADEVEGRTLTYLFTRPVSRVSILAGKFFAYVVTTLSFTLPPLVATFFLLTTTRGGGGIGARASDLFRDAGVIALALAVYGALFTLIGIVMRRPMILGLLFLYVWELWVPKLPGVLPRFTITAHVRSLLPSIPAEEREGLAALLATVEQTLPVTDSLITLGVLFFFFLAGAFWIFSGREYVLEQ